MTQPPRPSNEPFPKAAARLVARDERSLRELAKLLPYNHAHLHHFLTGRRTPRIDQMEQLAALLGVPASHFREIRVARIAEYLQVHHKLREKLWKELSLSRD